MNEPNVDRIRKYLQSQEVQERIQQRMHGARSKATVTISRAASLFDFSESQLREWEKRGLLKTERTALSRDSKTSTGHRQFSPDELDKLALIRELVDQGYTVSEIPQNIDNIWQQIIDKLQTQVSAKGSYEIKHVPIDKRVERTNEEVFWKYFVSQVLRLSLLLLCEGMPDTIAGMIIPLKRQDTLKQEYQPGNQLEVGPSLVGWLGKNRSFNSFLDTNPTFEFPSDFRLQPFPMVGDGKLQDNVLFFIERGARPLFPGDSLVETIRRLLELLYEHVDQWQPCLDYGMRDWEYQVTDLANPNASDEILNRLADMVMELGGKCSIVKTDGFFPRYSYRKTLTCQSSNAI
jgi:hypothetical protein